MRKVYILAMLLMASLVLSSPSSAMVKNKHRLASLEPKFRVKIEKLVEWLEVTFPHDEITIAETYRSPKKQNELYKKGNHITQVRGGFSKHQYNMAVDIYFIKDGKIRPFCPRYYYLGMQAQKLNLIWGGDWKMRDFGHLESPLSIKTIRRKL